jgi:hypothetical protein
MNYQLIINYMKKINSILIIALMVEAVFGFGSWLIKGLISG